MSKRKGGRREKNKLLETVYIVNEVGVAGEPLEPFFVRAKFRNIVGVVARTWMEPTWLDWRKMPNAWKGLLWDELKKVFQFPHGSDEKAKSYALKTYLNNKYVKNNLTPFEKYGKITQAQWDEIMRQKTIDEAKELSKANTTQAKRDMHKPYLGPGGEDAIAKGLPDPYEGLKECMFHWCKAREFKVARGQKDLAKPETKAVVSRIRSLAELQKAGKFVPDREKDCLTLNWKEGFTEDRAKYKKHGRYKQEMRQTAEEVYTKKLRDLVESSIPVLARQGLIVAQAPPSADLEGHAVDTITFPTPCELRIPLGIHGRTKEVVRSLAILGSGLFHGTPILPNYARVHIHSVEPKH
ncbi:hypothetical protein BS78_K035500 [Paspalum vaginatum]|uniref:Uncharacterized protein n=1 Tax=Paspalum vaginatum TaxID=158149 RepID=A0A9W8CG16_9POAL|nr:hypothetical protein BS78_K035500 [Paspalum vaginatum]